MPQYPEIRSGEIDEILGKTPGRIIRSGIAVFFVVIIVFLAGSWVFKYPDTIAGPVEITSDRPPAEVKARTSGKIDTIFVVNNQKVSKGELLGIIENPASFDEVNRLKRLLQEDVHEANDTFHHDISIENAGNKLGELQQFYTALRASQHALTTFNRIGYHTSKLLSWENSLAIISCFTIIPMISATHSKKITSWLGKIFYDTKNSLTNRSYRSRSWKRYRAFTWLKSWPLKIADQHWPV